MKRFFFCFLYLLLYWIWIDDDYCVCTIYKLYHKYLIFFSPDIGTVFLFPSSDVHTSHIVLQCTREFLLIRNETHFIYFLFIFLLLLLLLLLSLYRSYMKKKNGNKETVLYDTIHIKNTGNRLIYYLRFYILYTYTQHIYNKHKI